MTPLVALNQHVAAGQATGTVNSPGVGGNGGFSHIHMEAHAGGGCGADDVPFDDTHATRLECAPDFPAPRPSYLPNYTGQAMTRCSGTSMFYDDGDGSASLFRWRATGSSGASFQLQPTTPTGPFSLGNVGDRMAAGDFNADGVEDIVVAYQNNTGSFTYHVWGGASTYLGGWYTSGTFSLSRVAGRLVAGAW